MARRTDASMDLVSVSAGIRDVGIQRNTAFSRQPGLNGGGDLTSLADAMSQKSPSEAGSRSSKHGKSSKPSVASVASHSTKGDVDPLMSWLHQQPKPELKWFKRF